MTIYISEKDRIGLRVSKDVFKGNIPDGGVRQRIRATQWRMGAARTDVTKGEIEPYIQIHVEGANDLVGYVDYLSHRKLTVPIYSVGKSTFLRFSLPPDSAEDLDILLEQPCDLSLYEQDDFIYAVIETSKAALKSGAEPRISQQVPTGDLVLSEKMQFVGWNHYPPLMSALELTAINASRGFSAGAAVFTKTNVAEADFNEDAEKLTIWIPYEGKAIAERGLNNRVIGQSAVWKPGYYDALLTFTKSHT